jgi:hypothetical protein
MHVGAPSWEGSTAERRLNDCCRSEIFPYKSCIFYAVVTSLIALDRVALKKQVVDAPEVLSVIDQIPSLSSFLNSLYFCKYKEFFQVGSPTHLLHELLHHQLTEDGSPCPVSTDVLQPVVEM